MQTETLDKLYLEWSQFTEARTSREEALYHALDCAVRIANAAATGRELPADAGEMLSTANTTRRKYLEGDL